MAVPGISNTRLIISGLLIIVCFAILYPRLLHPMFASFLGQKPKQVKPKEMPSSIPPGRGSGMHPNMPQHIQEDIQRQMRGPHPGMRAAAEMNKQSTKGSGGRGGVMGMILPVYAIGIVAYLVYTLVKVFNKQNKGEYGKKGYGPQRRASQEREQIEDLKASSQQLTELESLLNKAEDKNISTDEMKELQKRLEDTEKQMAKILQAMQVVSTKIGSEASNQDSNVSSTNAETETKGEEEEKIVEKEVQEAGENTDNDIKDGEKEPGKVQDDKVESGKEGKEEEEEVVVLDDLTDKKEEESSVRHRKIHTEQES